MTNDERLDEIKRRLAAIGEPSWADCTHDAWHNEDEGYYQLRASGPVRSAAEGKAIAALQQVLSDQAFVNAAPDDVRWLVEQVEALERENRLLRQMLEGRR